MKHRAAWGALVAGGGLTLWRGGLATYWFIEWLRWRTSDPSAADLYQTNFFIEIVLTFAAITLALTGYYWLQPPRGR
ncbi:MAG: hypothetical protein EXR93_06820 [Gemmatimonadetes bacterium]|nr:hypothetical protein [Gemmatimonadota bacterium]